MINTVLGRRIAKLESATAALHPARIVQRHVISAQSEAARQARLQAILETSDGNVLHILRVIVSPDETGAA